MLDWYHIPLEIYSQNGIVGFYKDNKNGTVQEISEEEFFASLDSVEHFLEYTELYEQNARMLVYAEEIFSPDLSIARCFNPWLSFDVIV